MEVESAEQDGEKGEEQLPSNEPFSLDKYQLNPIPEQQ